MARTNMRGEVLFQVLLFFALGVVDLAHCQRYCEHRTPQIVTPKTVTTRWPAIQI